MRLVAGWAREIGLRPGIDRFGNLWGLPERAADAPLVTSGSHVDTVPGGGRLDGALGTVLALEAADALREGTPDGARFALLVCAAEEAPRFGAGTVGSRCLTGTLEDGELAGLHDRAGVSALDARADYLAQLADLPRVVDPPLARMRRHVEVHVEQRRALHRAGARVGVVERIAGPRRYSVEVQGRVGHAGEVPMLERADALACAAELVLAVESLALEERRPASVATVSRLSALPSALGVIPGTARLGLELRSTDLASLDRMESALERALARIAASRDVSLELQAIRRADPVQLDGALARAALGAAADLGAPAAATFSGAGHDAGQLAPLVPATMLLVPLAGGASHTPEERVEAADVALALDLLVRVLAGPG